MDISQELKLWDGSRHSSVVRAAIGQKQNAGQPASRVLRGLTSKRGAESLSAVGLLGL